MKKTRNYITLVLELTWRKTATIVYPSDITIEDLNILQNAILHQIGDSIKAPNYQKTFKEIGNILGKDGIDFLETEVI